MNRELRLAFLRACDRPSDMYRHVSRLRHLAAHCRRVTEFGVRYGVSGVGLIAGLPERYTGYDTRKEPDKRPLRRLAESNGVAYEHKQLDTLKAPPISETDLLLLDTKHTHEQVVAELRRHAARVKRFLVFHDTETYGTRINRAIREYRAANPRWHYERHHDDCHGLTILSTEEIPA